MTRADFETLLLTEPNLSRSTAHVFIAHPTPLEERTLGKLFLIAEIEDQSRISHDVIAVIQEEIRSAYYHAADFSVEAAFEQALAHVNQRLHQLIEGGVTDWLDRINAVVGIIRDHELVLTTLGRVHAFYLHGTRASDIADSPATREKINPLKVFGSVITGRIVSGDALLLTTASLLDYFSPERLRRFIADSPPGQAAGAIESALSERPPESTFAAIVLRVWVDDQLIQPTPLQSGASASLMMPDKPRASMDRLLSHERATDDLLSSSFWRSVIRGLSGLAAFVSNSVRRFLLHRPPRRKLANVTAPARPEVPYRTRFQEEYRPFYRRVIGALQMLGRSLLVGSFWLTRSVIRWIQQPRRAQDKARQLPARSSRFFERPLHWFARLTPRQRVVVLIGLVLILFFAQSVVSLGQRRQANLSSSEREAIVQQVKDKATEADAALSYGNEKGARQLDSEARALIAQLPNRSKSDKKTVDDLNAIFTSVRERLRHVVTVASPTAVADLAATSAQANPGAIGLAGGRIIAVESSGSRLFDVNPSTKDVIEVSLADQTLGDVKRIISDGTKSALLIGSTGLINYTPGSKALKSLLLSEASGESLDDASLYSSRLYVWSADNRQIFRHQRTASGFGQGTAWITEGTDDLSAVNSIVVNGSVFTLANNGNITEFQQGQRVDFNAVTPDPAWKAPAQLWSNENTSDLYVSDPGERRIVRFSKDGSIIAQYTSSSWADIRSFAVDLTSKTLYVLSGTAITSTPLTQ